jgi:threonine dehydrogenase-like Zn-dependent dehydrogenase
VAYLQTNADGIVHTITHTRPDGECVEVEIYDESLLGKRYLDGVFEEVVSTPTTPSESLVDKVARLEEQNLIIMEALATIYEENLALKAIVEGGTTV